ncbi:MAG TPA: DegT/DnrJ/EryC1/StrS family aminotransferase [Paludibacteraceae bacterium]|nr:DegT/DnrJ/EryC1/StrS family aminotransferase [Paludibacteraceae bacterium]
MLLYPRLNYKLSTKSYFKLLQPINKRKEPDLSNFFPEKEIFFYNHARYGLSEILKLFRKNSIVGVQPFTCPTVFEAIQQAEDQIYFIDVNSSLVIDIESLKIHKDKIDILIVTHTFGFTINIDEIIEIMGDKPVIEDCAHAFLSRKNGSLAGTKGDFAIFSFGFGKFPNAVSGGYVLVNNKNYLDIFKENYCFIKYPNYLKEIFFKCQSIMQILMNTCPFYGLLTRKIKNKKNKKQYKLSKKEKINYPYRFCMDIFSSELKKIACYFEKQKEFSGNIIKAIEKNPQITLMQYDFEMNNFMLAAEVEKPYKFITFAKIRGIEIGQHFYKSKYIIPYFGYKKGDCPTYEKIIEKMVTIPCHYNYSPKKHRQLLSIINSFKHE